VKKIKYLAPTIQACSLLLVGLIITIPAQAGTTVPGLIHLWSGEGNANDSVGTAHGTVSSTTAFSNGKKGQAFSFNGLQSAVVDPFPVNINPSALPKMTMGMWVNLRSIPNNQGWVLGHDNGGYDRSLNLHDSRYGFGVAGGTGRSPHSSSLLKLKDNLNSWHCVAASYDSVANTTTYYADGAVQTVSAAPGNGNAGATLGGLHNYGNHTVDGLVDEVFMFDRVLSATELDQVCGDLNGGLALQAHYPFDGDISDATGNTTGTLTGQSTFVAGKIGQAMSFDGNTVVSVPLDVNEVDYSVSLSFKTTRTAGNIYGVYGYGHDRDLFINASGNTCAYVWSWELICSSGTNYADGVFHDLVHVLNGTHQIIYVDGIEVVRGNKGISDFDWQNSIRIGTGYKGSFIGDIDDVKIYGKALTATEISAQSASNSPPTANAGTTQTLESTGNDRADVTLNGSGSNDADGDTLTYNWSWNGGTATGANPTASFPRGTTLVTLSVDDGNGETDSAAVEITVVDTTPPTVNAGADVTLEATDVGGAAFDVLAQSSANDVGCSSAALSAMTPAFYPLLDTTVTVTATDCANLTATDSMLLTVEDTTAPILTLPANVNIEASGAQTPVAIGTATATDIFGFTITNDAPATYGLGTTVVTWTATDDNGNITTATQNAVVVDTTAPTVTANLTPVSRGDDGDDSDEGRFTVNFSISDIVDANPTVIAELIVAGHATALTVTNGQLIEFEYEDEKTEIEVENGILEIEAPSMVLRVTATDASGNVTVVEIQPQGLTRDNDDDHDRDDDHDD